VTLNEDHRYFVPEYYRSKEFYKQQYGIYRRYKKEDRQKELMFLLRQLCQLRFERVLLKTALRRGERYVETLEEKLEHLENLFEICRVAKERYG
jgi:hypothetical protein